MNCDIFRLPCMCATLRRTSRAVSQMYDEAFRPLGLRSTQYTILGVLCKEGEMKQRRVGELLALDRTTLTRVLKIMEANRWISSIPGVDRRERLVRASEEGRKLFEEATPRWGEVQDRLKAAFGASQWDDVLRLAERMSHGAGRAARGGRNAPIET